MSEKKHEGCFDMQEAYQKIEDGVVGGYKKIENGAVSGFRKVCDFFIRKLFSRKGETVEQTRERLTRK